MYSPPVRRKYASYEQLEGCGSLDLGVDVLLKLTDRDGEDLGEGIVNLTYMLREGILGQPNVIEVSMCAQ